MTYHYDYGYGEQGDALVRLFRSGSPDFPAAEELIRQGADINAIGNDDDENMLSEILGGYWESEGDGQNCRNLNPRLGYHMCQVIRFFLDHGFDVNKRDGCFGAQCLYALTLSSFDRHMIEATKLLLDAGARNRTILPQSTDEDETPWNFIATEGSYQGACERNHRLANIFEAVYQVYQAVEDGRPYSGIDSYEIAIGKKITKVLAQGKGASPTFYSMELPEFRKDNCYTQTLYFVYDGGVLITTQYADFWTDTLLPDGDFVDVSSYFDGIVDDTVKEFHFDNRSVLKGNTCYSQPITTMEMDSGRKVRFSINFGEVSNEERAAFYEILD